jgi:hypothetical protein
MKLVLFLFTLLMTPVFCTASSVDLWSLYQEELTDTSPIVTAIIDTKNVEDIMVDVVTDKGSTIVITPILNSSGTPVLTDPSDTVTISNGGGSERVVYSRIMAPRAKVVVTKTEAGDTSDFVLSIRGNK